MAIHSFLKAEKGDPDWQFSPEGYIGKEFKIIDANTVELEEGETDQVILRQNPTEKELLAKHLNINLQKNANLDLIILNDLGKNLQQVFLYDIHIKAGASLNLGMFIKDGKLNKHIIQVFQEKESTFTGYGLISNMVSGDTEIVTKIIHHGEYSISNQIFLGLAGDNSQTVFQGASIAEASAEGSQIAIENGNLITGINGKCYSKPEIYLNSEYSNSVQGAETNTISLEKIGYLQSKGITEENAKALITSSFRNQVISLIIQENIQAEVKEMYTD